MPTGYTQGIVDGKIKTFQEFAKQCIRAFGAAIHMRDDSMDIEYKPMVISTYHREELQKAKRELDKAKILNDAELIEMRTEELKNDIINCKNTIAKAKANKAKLEEFLIKASKFKPPTVEHNDFKNFMIEQLNTTLKFDGDYDHYEKRLTQLEMELQNIDANQIRFSLIEQANKDIAYHLKNHKFELKRCSDANEWVRKLFDAL